MEVFLYLTLLNKMILMTHLFGRDVYVRCECATKIAWQTHFFIMNVLHAIMNVLRFALARLLQRMFCLRINNNVA